MSARIPRWISLAAAAKRIVATCGVNEDAAWATLEDLLQNGSIIAKHVENGRKGRWARPIEPERWWATGWAEPLLARERTGSSVLVDETQLDAALAGETSPAPLLIGFGAVREHIQKLAESVERLGRAQEKQTTRARFVAQLVGDAAKGVAWDWGSLAKSKGRGRPSLKWLYSGEMVRGAMAGERRPNFKHEVRRLIEWGEQNLPEEFRVSDRQLRELEALHKLLDGVQPEPNA